MSYLDRYKRRVRRSGEDVGEALTNNTIEFIDSTFHASSTYRVMSVESSKYDIDEIDGRVVQVERLGSLREIILRPTKSLEVGMYIEIDDEWFLLIDKYGGTGSTSIKMLAIKINESLKWRDENQYNNYIKNKDNDDYIDNDFHEFKCVASATDLGSKSKQSKNEIEWNKYDVRLPVGQLFVSVEKNKHTEKIDLNDRFIFGRNVYEIVGIDDITLVDDEGYGIIQYTVKITTRRNRDDFINGIAENTYGEQIDDDIDSENGEDGGDRLW